MDKNEGSEKQPRRSPFSFAKEYGRYERQLVIRNGHETGAFCLPGNRWRMTIRNH